MEWTPGRVFALIFVTNLLTNFDSGALPGVLTQLRATPTYTTPTELGHAERKVSRGHGHKHGSGHHTQHPDHAAAHAEHAVPVEAHGHSSSADHDSAADAKTSGKDHGRGGDHAPPPDEAASSSHAKQAGHGAPEESADKGTKAQRKTSAKGAQGAGKGGGGGKENRKHKGRDDALSAEDKRARKEAELAQRAQESRERAEAAAIQKAARAATKAAAKWAKEDAEPPKKESGKETSGADAKKAAHAKKKKKKSPKPHDTKEDHGARRLQEANAPVCEKDCHGFSMSYLASGVLGSLPYIALSLVSPLVGTVLQQARVRRVLVLAITINGAACVLFGLSPSTSALMVTRFAVGVSQAFAVIYFPVWVDSKANPASKTWQMSLMQIGVPLGIVLGYLIGGLITSMIDTDHMAVAGWRWPFLLQGALLVPLGLVLASVPSSMLEVDADSVPLVSPGKARRPSPLSTTSKATASNGVGELSACAMFGILLKSPVYICVLLCLSSIFFVVSGIQYWVTIFLLQYFNMDHRTVVRPCLPGEGNVAGGGRHRCRHTPRAWRSSQVLLFALVSSTGPLIGVLAGGWIVDRAGGYENHPRCLRILANYTVVGIALAAGIALSERAYVVVALIWCLLVVGGAVLAPATGILITAVPPAVRTFASAISMMSYNVLGYFLAPVVSGAVIQYYGIHWGFRVVVSWVVFSCFFLAIAICAADSAARRGLHDGGSTPSSAGRTAPRSGRQRSFSLVRRKDGSVEVKEVPGPKRDASFVPNGMRELL